MNANLYELLRTHFSVALDRQFLAPPGAEAVTYRDIDGRSARLARVLVDRGVAIGDRVVVQVSKTPDAVALYLACLRVGAIYVPLNTAYTDAEVAFFAADAEPTIVVDDARLAELAQQADTAEPLPEVAPRLADDIAAMLYTSGTTGRSKGAMLTHANLASNALALHAIWRFEPGDVLLHTLPIFHVHGLFVALHTAMLNASTVLFLERFDTDTVLDLLPQATVLMGVPTHYTRLLADDRFGTDACSSIRLFTSGSAPMTALVHDEFAARTGHRILERYGMTEAGMITSNPYDGDRVAGTVGFPLPQVQLRVRRDDGELVQPGEIGVVEVRGPNLFAGYWKLPDKTAAEHTDDGFFITGDVGFVDEEGRLTLEGRSSDMIISGGYNVYPREIEQAIDDLDGVAESAVIGAPHDDLGEIPVAFVVAADGADLVVSDVVSALEGRLARFKIPRRVDIVDSLPRNAMGKVQKALLRHGPDDLG